MPKYYFSAFVILSLLSSSSTVGAAEGSSTKPKKSVGFSNTVQVKKIEKVATNPKPVKKHHSTRTKNFENTKNNLSAYQESLEHASHQQKKYNQLHQSLQKALPSTPPSSRALKKLQVQMAKTEKDIQLLEKRNRDLEAKNLLTLEQKKQLQTKEQNLKDLKTQYARALDQAPARNELNSKYGRLGKLFKRNAYRKEKQALETNADLYKEPSTITEYNILDDEAWGSQTHNTRARALKKFKKEKDEEVNSLTKKVKNAETVIRERENYNSQDQLDYEANPNPDDERLTNMEDRSHVRFSPPSYGKDNPQPKKSSLKKPSPPSSTWKAGVVRRSGQN